MRLSTRNQLTGTVVSVEPGNVMTIVKVNLDGAQQVTAAITKGGAEELHVAAGGQVSVLISPARSCSPSTS